MSINFTEGQTVHAGDLLAQIDPRPYQALIDQYTGNLERDQAQLINAQANLTRYTTLRSGPALVPQCGVAGEIGLSANELGLIAFQVSSGLIAQGLVGTRIDLRQQAAGLHGLA